VVKLHFISAGEDPNTVEKPNLAGYTSVACSLIVLKPVSIYAFKRIGVVRRVVYGGEMLQEDTTLSRLFSRLVDADYFIV
jgi:hypothetical protein